MGGLGSVDAMEETRWATSAVGGGGRANSPCDRDGTHSLRRCSSMHPWQKRWRHGETTLTFLRVPQQMAHRVSARTDPSFTDMLLRISRSLNCAVWARRASRIINSCKIRSALPRALRVNHHDALRRRPIRRDPRGVHRVRARSISRAIRARRLPVAVHPARLLRILSSILNA